MVDEARIKFEPFFKIYRLQIDDKSSTILIGLDKNDVKKLVNDLSCWGFCISREYEQVESKVKNCEKCKLWIRNKLTVDYGNCTCNKFHYTGDNEQKIMDGLMYTDSEGHSAYYYTGKNFGCIHFIPKS